MVTIYIMGKQYQVAKGLTIQKAQEAAGYKLLRGCGCRGGFCGACGTVYRVPPEAKLRVGLACQTVIEDNMYIAQIPFFPANKVKYSIEEVEADISTVMALYPEVVRCLQCGTCNKICPQDINVMNYIACAIKGYSNSSFTMTSASSSGLFAFPFFTFWLPPYINFCTWFCKWKETRTETILNIFTKQLFGKINKCSF